MVDIAVTVAREFWAVLGEMAPYLLFGFLTAGLLSALISAQTVERHLGGKGMWPVLKAAAFGVPLPLCSCGVIPVSASLRRHGATRGATTAFLLSTPQTGVDSIMVTLSLLGGVFAVFRPLAALATGLVGGWLVTLLDSPDKPDSAHGVQGAACQDACCTGGHGRGGVSRALHYGFVTLPRDIGRSLLIGLVAAGLISALLPDDLFANVLGTGVGAMLVMMALGIPVYVCATASVPVAAALILKGGITPGAALVFLMTGPATNAATIAIVWKVMGKRTALVYLGTVAAGALGAGLLLDQIYTQTGLAATPYMPWMIPSVVKAGCAVMLLAVLVPAFWRRTPAAQAAGAKQQEPDTSGASRTATLAIRGMTCSHCAANVRRVLLECPGVETATVDHVTGQAVVTGHDLDPHTLRQAAESLGYAVRGTALA